MGQTLETDDAKQMAANFFAEPLKSMRVRPHTVTQRAVVLDFHSCTILVYVPKVSPLPVNALVHAALDNLTRK